MKIGKEKIKGLVQRNIASGLAYYWLPTPKERAAGWSGFALGQDLAAAITGAKQRNEDVDAWKNGAASPRAIKKYVKASTFDALLDRYEREKLVTMAASTQRVDATAIRRLREWAGDQPLAWITRTRVKALRDAMMKHAVLNGPGHAPAFHTLTTLRKVFTWGIDELDLAMANPAERFGLAMPAPREQVWESDARTLFSEAATAAGWHSVGFAVRLGAYYAQREADILGLTRASWREVSLRQLGMNDQMYEALKSDHGPDAGKVMGLYVKQGKTNRWVGVPVEGQMRDEIEATIAAATERAKNGNGKLAQLAAARLVSHDKTGQPWRQREFIERVSDVRAAAAELARKQGNDELAERISDLEFRDLRRTCVVTMGELGMDDAAISAITGHKLETIKRILETYMPRTEVMAARGVIARIGPRPAPPATAREA